MASNKIGRANGDEPFTFIVFVERARRLIPVAHLGRRPLHSKHHNRKDSMKMSLWLGVTTVALALCGCSKPNEHSATTAGPDVMGTWRVTISTADGTITGMASLKQTGNEVTGWVGPNQDNPIPIAGVLNGNRLTMKTSPQPGRTVAFDRCDLTVNDHKMVGTIEGGDAKKGTIEFVRTTP